MLVLAVGAADAMAAKPIRIPWNVALVAVCLVLVVLDLLPRAPLDPEGVLVAMPVPSLSRSGLAAGRAASRSRS